MRWYKAIFLLVALLVLGFFAYNNRLQIKQVVDLLLTKVGIQSPCSTIGYSIGSIDSRFGVSKDQFLTKIEKATKIWEDTTGNNLFEYKENGTLIINLTYDYRQAATDKLKSIGYVIKNDKATYDSLKTRYESLLSSYRANKSAFEAEMARINADKAAYEKEVAYWNSRKGAPKNEYDRLQKVQAGINERVKALISKQDELNNTADTINSLITVINQLIENLNLNVEKYNTTTKETGEEFSDGEYISDVTGRTINIYQFENEDKLLRVLAHEMGHALGLRHVDDTNAIMYRLNEVNSKKLTEADTTELNRVCK